MLALFTIFTLYLDRKTLLFSHFFNFTGNVQLLALILNLEWHVCHMLIGGLLLPIANTQKKCIIWVVSACSYSLGGIKNTLRANLLSGGNGVECDCHICKFPPLFLPGVCVSILIPRLIGVTTNLNHVLCM